MTEHDNLKKLPAACAARRQSDGAPTIIVAGQVGYHLQDSDFDPKSYNWLHQITAKQVGAMINGLMMGWDVPDADPENCEGRAARDLGAV